jgi:hypothetical protein
MDADVTMSVEYGCVVWTLVILFLLNIMIHNSPVCSRKKSLNLLPYFFYICGLLAIIEVVALVVPRPKFHHSL